MLFGQLSPVPFFQWRRFLAMAFGAKIHPTAFLYPRVRIWDPQNLVMDFEATLANGVDCYNIDLVVIGPEATVSQDTMLCTASHDLEDPARSLITAPIHLEWASWIFARVFVGPGVVIGEGGVVGAGSVVTKSVDAWTIVAGNPAKAIKSRVIRGRTNL